MSIRGNSRCFRTPPILMLLSAVTLSTFAAASTTRDQLLEVWDRNKRELDSPFVMMRNSRAIEIAHGSAIHPVTVEAILTGTANAQLEPNRPGAQMGSVSGAGDVNGDGYDDVIVGAYKYDAGFTEGGAAFVYHGSSTGIDPVPDTQWEANEDYTWLGATVSGAGDVNGDGYDDVIIGAPLYGTGGAAFVHLGSPTGVETPVAAQLEPGQAGVLFGWRVSGAGDVNGDGYDDVIVGAIDYGSGGAAFIHLGSLTGVETTAAVRLEPDMEDVQFGWSVSGAGDVNGDGHDDVIVGAIYYDGGAAFVYHGSAAGVETTAAAQLETDQGLTFMGAGVSGAGDVNGDGYADVIVGSIGYSNGETAEGAAFVYHGSSTGVDAAAAAQLESNQEGAWMGQGVSGAGDFNGDGYDDVIVGVERYDDVQTDEGAVFIYRGSAAGIEPAPAARIGSNQEGASMGQSVSGAGDVNGDGYDDVIAGALNYDNGEADEGAAFVYHGATTDGDGDGIEDRTEDGGPNGGDGNDDGIPDSTQPNVTTLLAANGNGYITLISTCELRDVEAVLKDHLQPTRLLFPYALVEFRLPCATADLMILFHAGDGWNPEDGYWKYGPETPGQALTTKWYELPGAIFDTTTIAGTTVARVSFVLRDGQPGDDTGIDGQIVDQGGPGAPGSVAAVPTSSGAMMMLLAMILAAAGVWRLRA